MNRDSLLLRLLNYFRLAFDRIEAPGRFINLSHSVSIADLACNCRRIFSDDDTVEYMQNNQQVNGLARTTKRKASPAWAKANKTKARAKASLERANARTRTKERVDNTARKERKDFTNNRIWHMNWIQNKMTGGHNIWSRNWKNDRVRNKLTGHSIESVLQAVGVRSERRCRQITFGIDTAACRTVVPARHPATPAMMGYKCHQDVESGVQYSTASKSVVWGEGLRLTMSEDKEGKLMTIESRQAEVRRPLMAAKPMTPQGQWVCFGLDREFAYTIETGRIIPFESTPNGWNITVGCKAPNDANSK